MSFNKYYIYLNILEAEAGILNINLNRKPSKYIFFHLYSILKGSART